MEPGRTPARHLSYALALASMLFVLTTSLLAQETRGRLTGQVSDTTRAPIAGATVSIAEVSRGTTVTATTDSDGLFQANYLLPGSYRVTVELTGQEARSGQRPAADERDP
jgi:hypothetical protein